MALIDKANFSDFEKMGFKQERNDQHDPRGYTWFLKNENFQILIDSWMMVTLFRGEKYIVVSIDDLYDLNELIGFIK